MGSSNDDIEDILNRRGLSELQKKLIYSYLNKRKATGWVEPKAKRKTPAQLRKEIPALQDAWEQYQIILKLVRGQEAK